MFQTKPEPTRNQTGCGTKNLLPFLSNQPLNNIILLWHIKGYRTSTQQHFLHTESIRSLWIKKYYVQWKNVTIFYLASADELCIMSSLGTHKHSRATLKSNVSAAMIRSAYLSPGWRPLGQNLYNNFSTDCWHSLFCRICF